MNAGNADVLVGKCSRADEDVGVRSTLFFCNLICVHQCSSVAILHFLRVPGVSAVNNPGLAVHAISLIFPAQKSPLWQYEAHEARR